MKTWPEAAREAAEATYADEVKAAETPEKSRDSSLSLIPKIQRDAKNCSLQDLGWGLGGLKLS